MRSIRASILRLNSSSTARCTLLSVKQSCRSFNCHIKSLKFQDANERSFLRVTTRQIHKISGASTRQMADLEDRIYKYVGSSVEDPEAKLSLKTLGWMNRRIAVSKDNTIQLLLRLPTLLHPSLDQLKDRIKESAEKEVQAWAKDIGITDNLSVNVEAVASKPISWLVKDEEDQKELESRLGPGLANVAHIIGVYSCKVCLSHMILIAVLHPSVDPNSMHRNFQNRVEWENQPSPSTLPTNWRKWVDESGCWILMYTGHLFQFLSSQKT